MASQTKSFTIGALVVAILALTAGFFIYEQQSEADIEIDLPKVDLKK